MRVLRILTLLIACAAVVFPQAKINGVRIMPEVSSGSVSNPATDQLAIYSCDDGGTTKLCSKDSAGTVAIGLGGGGASITTTYDTWANRPAAGNAGDLFKSSNSPYECRDNGSTWDCWFMGFPVTPPPSTGWTLISGSTATTSLTDGSLKMVADANTAANNVDLYCRAVTPPYTITVDFIPAFGTSTGNGSVGVGYYQSSDGKFVWYRLLNGNSIRADKWTNRTTFLASYRTDTLSANIAAPHFTIQLADDNTTNRTVKIWGVSNSNLITYHTVGRTDFLTADNACVMLDSGGTTAVTNYAAARVFNWLVQ